MSGDYDDYDDGNYNDGDYRDYDDEDYTGDYGDYGYTGDEDLNLADEDYDDGVKKGYNDFERAEQYGEYKEEKYGEERNIHERVEKQTGYVSMENRKMMSEEEKFMGDISIYLSEIKKNKKLKDISSSFPDSLFFHDKVSLLGESVKYKNPLAYILGYYCLEKKIINKDRLKNCEKIIEELENIIGLEDVIRYSFYWNLYLI